MYWIYFFTYFVQDTFDMAFKILQIKLVQWSLIKIISPREGPLTWTSIYLSIQIIFRSTITLGNKNSLGGCGGHINTWEVGGTFHRENNFNQISLR